MKILLIEDSPEIVNALSLTFKIRWPEATFISTDRGAKGIEMVEIESPDMVILDINLPDMSGFKVLKHIRLFSEVPVIILTIREEEVDKVRGLETGADDYITKPFSTIDLLARVKAVLRRSSIRYTGEEEPLLVAGTLTINFSTREVFLGDQKLHLTPTEYKVLCCLIRNKGRIVTQETLKQQVWGSAKYVDASAIKKYIYQLRTKLGDTSDPQRIILNERGVGYKFIKPA